jgi:hypothetical protein
MKTYILLLFAAFFVQQLNAQALPIYCGLSYHYDNSGNRIQREVTTDCSSGKTSLNNANSNSDSTSLELKESIYPNPTAGNFNVVFNNAINTGWLVI